MGLSNELSCEAGRSSHHFKPHRGFQSEVLRPYFPVLEPWVVWSVSRPSSSSWFIRMQKWGCPLHHPLPRPPWSSSHYLACESSQPSCLSLPLLPVWMNVSSLTPWFSDFHTVQFSGSSGYFLFLSLLSFFWLCEKAKCIYLCLHLGQKSP